jgi:sugar phosphate isomerase/epimerase
MNRLSVRAHDLGKMPASALIEAAKACGFDGIQLVLSKALTETIDLTDPTTFPNALQTVPIDVLGGYFNMVHPDSAVVEAGIRQFEDLLQVQHELNASCVASETGSRMGSPWGYHPDNHSETSFQAVLKIVKRLVKTAETSDSTVAIEGAFAHVVHRPVRMARLLEAIPSVHLKVIVDLYNYLYIDNHEHHVSILKECLALFGSRIHAFHLKDYRIENDQLVQVGLGDGLMRYDAILPLIEAACPDAPLIFEGVKKEDMNRSVAFIRGLQRRNGHV